MKLQTTLVLLTGIIIGACDQHKDTERQEAYKELQFFVERVETEIAYRDEHNWPKIGQQYKKLENKAEDAWRKVKGDERRALDELEIRYELIEADEKRKKKQIRDNARFHMNNLEIWYNLKSSDFDSDVKRQIAETGARQSVQWFKENYYNLEIRTRKRYEDNLSRWEFDF